MVSIVLFCLPIFFELNAQASFHDRAIKNIDTIIQDMTLEEKVGQLFFGFVYGEDLTDEAKDIIATSKIGNIIYYSWANGLTKRAQVRTLSGQLQEYMLQIVGVPAIISVDQEGGRVFRLSGEFTTFPSMGTVASNQDPLEASQMAFCMAQEMHDVGITLNFAPVVDVNSNPKNPVIGTRSFSSEPDEVIRFARAMISGFHRGKVGVTLKHFPGHGDAMVDSHFGLPCVQKTQKELFECELKPFCALCGEADAIMTAHLMVPSLDPNQCATFSTSILTDLLRKKLDFRGIVISDSLAMKGVVPHQQSLQEAVEGVSEAAIRAFQAGCDCLLLGRLEWADFFEAKEPLPNMHMMKHVLKNFCEAVKVGRISKERVDDSVRRILFLKKTEKIALSL